MSSDTIEAAVFPAVSTDATASVKRPLKRAAEGPLIPVPMKLPAALRHELRALAGQQGVTLSAYVRKTFGRRTSLSCRDCAAWR